MNHCGHYCVGINGPQKRCRNGLCTEARCHTEKPTQEDITYAVPLPHKGVVAQEKPQIGTTGNDMGYPTAVFSGTPEQSEKPERGKAFMEEWNHEAPKQSQEKKCICGENSPDSIVVHRPDGSCYLRSRPEQSLAGQAMEERFDEAFLSYDCKSANKHECHLEKYRTRIKAFITEECAKAEERGRIHGNERYNEGYAHGREDYEKIGAARERDRIVAIVEGLKGTMHGDAADCILVEVIHSIQEPTDV